MTRALALLSKSGALALLGRVGALEALARLLSAVRLGSDAFVAQVEAQGLEGEARTVVCGLKEARITGLMASLVAESLGTTNPLPGVRHIEEAFELKHFASTLEEAGYAVTWARKQPRATQPYCPAGSGTL